MPKALTQDDIDLLATHVAAGDRIAYYTQLAEWGYRYAALALGVVSNDTFAGRVANEYFQHQSHEEGQFLNDDQIALMSQGLMEADFALREAAGSNSRDYGRGARQ
ncbi:MAG TPA: hypothetical protein ENJ46_00555 [Hellea balneolensis]|uniref:Uncharacterized protein n=1 Tax=Hellea balneolensis TaxID=287478 RepID=A0A7C3CBB1_9PROT|nr:hypothetical protein [Hellea balneolensis]